MTDHDSVFVEAHRRAVALVTAFVAHVESGDDVDGQLFDQLLREAAEVDAVGTLVAFAVLAWQLLRDVDDGTLAELAVSLARIDAGLAD